MRPETPAVSVIMPAYNSESYIREAIASVQAQTVTDWELFVIDDASSDRTVEIVTELAAQDERIRLYTNAQNVGVSHCRNRGLELSRGRFIALLDSDDIWLPEKLERQIELAEKTGADIVYCSYEIVDEKLIPCCDDFLVPEETTFDETLVSSVISCSTALLRSETCRSFRFPTEFYHEDYVYWLKLLQSGHRAVGIRRPLARYRTRNDSRAHNKIACALKRWRIYRVFLRYSFWKSARIFLRYARAGLVKYRQKKPENTARAS